MMNYIKFKIWPWVKVKFIYWWWLIKYGGKKNIPSEVVFKKIEEIAESLFEDLRNAVRASSLNEMSEEERLKMREALMKVSEFEGEIKNLRK